MEVTVLDERVSTRSNSLTSEAGTNWAPYLQMNWAINSHTYTLTHYTHYVLSLPPQECSGWNEGAHGSVEDSSVSIEKSCACTVAKAKRHTAWLGVLHWCNTQWHNIFYCQPTEAYTEAQTRPLQRPRSGKAVQLISLTVWENVVI